MALGALGVVYGDIGTSPLYSIRECFSGSHALTPDAPNVLGVLCLVFWALILVVVVKYLVTVMRADNRGEGGIMALLALVSSSKRNGALTVPVLLGLVGTSLLFAEGMITPGISVLSAVEGLEVAAPALKQAVVPLTLIILVVLFLIQKRGTAAVGAVFGPAMAVWFLTIGALGLIWIVREPAVLAAVNPIHGLRFFLAHGTHGFLVLGAVVLVLTGAEALYADMGHFGAGPIRLAWFTMVLPSLMLNYFGQGAALLLRGSEAAVHPFYALAPSGLLYPLTAIATVATVIASQALISGGFSLGQQAVQLGFSPRLAIIHTSHHKRGQIFIPEINSLLMVACCILVLAFRSSSGLAAAYGVSVMGTMTITSILIFVVMRKRWGMGLLPSTALVGLFLTVDLTFLSANLTKLAHGGWVPLLIGGMLLAVMTTWKRGRQALADELRRSFLPLAEALKSLGQEPLTRVKGTAVFMTSNLDVVPPVLLHHFRHNKVLHEQVVLLYVVTESVPEVPRGEQLELSALGHGVFQVIGHYGFMQLPDVPDLLSRCAEKDLKIDLDDTSYYLGRETLLTSGRSGMSNWRKSLFGFLSRNARPATAFFGIPANRVVEMGMQIEL
jgi:KUP system potassium uptake protein